jgi:hypothetical protein
VSPWKPAFAVNILIFKRFRRGGKKSAGLSTVGGTLSDRLISGAANNPGRRGLHPALAG